MLIVVLVVSAWVQSTHSAVIQPCDDFVQARDEFFASEEVGPRRAAFARMVEHLPHGLPHHNPARSSADQRERLRRESFAPLLAHPLGRPYLEAILSEPANFSPAVASVAANLLGDDGDQVELRLLLSSFRAASGEHRRALGGPLGRVCGRLQGAVASRRTVDEVLNLLRESASSNNGQERAGGILGLFEAGDRIGAQHQLLTLLAADRNPRQQLRDLSLCRRLLDDPDTPAELRNRSHQIARDQVSQILDDPDLDVDSPHFRVSSTARTFQSATHFLAADAEAEEVGFFLRCYSHPRSARLLGMDGLLELRTTLQRLRGGLEGEERRRLDGFVLDQLLQPAERLFFLEEDPMDVAEYQLFRGGADYRYNAADYFASLFSLQREGVAELFVSDSEILEFLTLLMQAGQEVVEGQGNDRLFFGVEEKRETRILCGLLLAYESRESGTSQTSGLGLDEYFLAVLVEEQQAPREEVLRSHQALLAARCPHLWLEVPEVRAPLDGWVRSVAMSGLQTLGYEVRMAETCVLLRSPLATEAGG
jgi:hypothetical protein